MKTAKLVLAAAMTMLSSHALADGVAPITFTTDFDVIVLIGANTFHMPIPTARGQRFNLPVALNSWNCSATDKHISDDGNDYYVNVLCDPVNNAGFVGVTISCPSHAPGSYSTHFFLRSDSGPLVEATMAGTCITHGVRPPTPTGQRL